MKRSGIIIIFVFLKTSLIAQVTHFNHFIFSIPTGWTTNEQTDFFILNPPDLAGNESLSFIFLKPVIETNFETVALQVLQDMATGLNGTLMNESISIPSSPHLSKEISGKSFKGWDYYKCFGHVKAPIPNDPYSAIIWEINIFLVKINNRMEQMVMMSRDVHDGAKESTTWRNPKYINFAREFCFSFEFDDWKDLPFVNGKVSNQGLSGLWNGLNYKVNAPSNIFTTTAQNTYLIFFDNGQVYYNSKFPDKGLDEINTLIEAEWHPGLWGHYTLQDGKGLIQLSFASMPFQFTGNALSVNYMKQKHDYKFFPTTNYISFAGTWCGSGEVYGSSACISFTSDGKFNDNGLIRALEHSLNDYYVATPTSGSGTYSVKNNSIIFKFKNGFVFKTAFTGMNYPPGNNSPGQISFGSSEMSFQRN